MQRQQFDLPHPILTLGGRAKVVLLGMAQRQTLPETVGETANHYHICISYASLVGTVLLSCRLANSAVARTFAGQEEDGSTSSGEAEGAEGAGGWSAVTGSAVEGGGDWAQGAEKKQWGLRLRWVVEVFVHAADPADRSSRQTEGEGEGGAVCDPSRRWFKMRAFTDTPCLQFAKRYARRAPKAPEDAEDAPLMLAADFGGGMLPVDEGVDLGTFAVEGRLDLVDTSLSLVEVEYLPQARMLA